MNNRISIGYRPVYANLGEQLLDVMAITIDKDGSSRARDRFQQVVNAAGASTGIDSEGGFLVETQHSSDIYQTAIEDGVFSRRCTRQPVGAQFDSFEYPVAENRDRSTGKLAGIQVYRKSETEAMQSSGKALLKEAEIRLEDMYGLVYLTNRLVRDSVAMTEFVKRTVVQQFARRLDQEIFEGTGVGQCLGIMGSGCKILVAKEADQTEKTILGENIAKMLSRFSGNAKSAAWFVNQECLEKLPLLKVDNVPIYAPGSTFDGSAWGTLVGRPVITSEHCEALGTEGDIVLADFSQYLLISKGGAEVAQSVHVKFLSDETAFRFLVRNNGQPIHDEPITPLKGTQTLSPFVILEAR